MRNEATAPAGGTAAPRLDLLEFEVWGFVSKPPEEVYEAVADPQQLSQYFTTGGAKGRLVPKAKVSWDFADFPGRFPVHVLAAEPPLRLVLAWAAAPGSTPHGEADTRVTFRFVPVDGGARTKVTIAETGWAVTEAGSGAAFGNSMGWAGFIAALKVWLEHGINLREGFYK